MKKSKAILLIVFALIVGGALHGILGTQTAQEDVRAAATPEVVYVFVTPAAQKTVRAADPTAVLAENAAAPTATQPPAVAAVKVTATPTAAPSYATLARGDKGDDVKKLQNRLNALGFSAGTADGIYGSKTESAIESFQALAGLSATGTADGKTQSALWDAGTPTARPTEADAGSSGEVTYILNKNTKKFHYPSCSSVDQMKESNKIYFTGTRDEAIDMGYVPCQRCKP